MSATPTRLLIKSLLLPAHAIPAYIVQPVVVADRFDHVRCLSIAAFAAINFVVFSRNHDWLSGSYHVKVRQPAALLSFEQLIHEFTRTNTKLADS
jgi:hypothetical protein